MSSTITLLIASFVTVAACLASVGSFAGDDPAPTTVCQLLTHSADFAGKFVAVDGIARVEGRYSLIDKTCPASHLHVEIYFAVYAENAGVAKLVQQLDRVDAGGLRAPAVQAKFEGQFIVNHERFPSKVLVLKSVRDAKTIPDPE